jgi:hypothetical protein
LRLALNTKLDLSSATVPKIFFRKPDGTTGTWDAAIAGKELIKNFTISEFLDQEGDWFFQPYVEIDGRSAPGDIVKVYVSKPIKTAP